MNFWNTLKKPIFILAPMEDVTDSVFRQIVAVSGKPDVFFTEFTSVDGILSVGFKQVSQRLLYTKAERPIVAQIWGNDPDNFFKAAKIIKRMGFDGIDINMGCPVKNIVKSGSCSALIKNPRLAQEIIKFTQKGAGGLPISVKTRIGFSQIQTEEWVNILLECNIDTLTLHLRTAKEMSKTPPHWEEIKKAVEIRNQLGVKTLILGNGDVKNLKEAKEKVKDYGIDGVMIGRAIFENIWLFNPKIKIEDIKVEEKLNLLIKHANLFNKTWGSSKNFSILKKFFKCYVNNFPGSADLRLKLMSANNPLEIKEIIKGSILRR